jgi:AcrR family transcriptional regulator
VVTLRLLLDLDTSRIFRYFPTKEDVLLSGLEEVGERVREALAARPADEPVWDSLRLAFHHLVGVPGSPGGHLTEIADVIVSSTSIQSRSMEKRQQWEDILVPEIASRLPRTAHDIDLSKQDHAAALLGAGLGCVDIATRIWLRENRSVDPVAILDALMGQLRLDQPVQEAQ